MRSCRHGDAVRTGSRAAPDRPTGGTRIDDNHPYKDDARAGDAARRPVVVLDEATASLDPDNEYEIRAALAEACRGKTVVVIAHRPNTIASADRVVRFDAGRVVDTVSGFADLETLQAALRA